MQRIGIFGGTFNPVHSEHVSLAKTAVKELNLDKLFIVPTFISPHKSTASVSAEHRVNMLKLAFLGEDKIEISNFEINSGGVSYSYITAEYFKNNFPSAQIFLIVGADMLKDFKTWKYPQRILNAVTLVGAKRQDFIADFSKESEYIESEYGKNVEFLTFNGESRSSTKIRVYASLGLSLSGMTSDKVQEYITANNLYEGGLYYEYLKRVLPEKRLIHTANVIVTALKKVKELGLDANKVEISALLHDVAKYQDPTSYKDFCLEEKVPNPVVHAFLGAYVCEKVLGIKDRDIINAVKYHTSGRPNMSSLEKLIFVADMVEEGRNYEGVEYLRALYENNTLDECFRECLKEELLHLKNKKTEIFRLTEEAYEYYAKE